MKIKTKEKNNEASQISPDYVRISMAAQLNLDLSLDGSHAVTVIALTCCKIIPEDAMRIVLIADWHVSVRELRKTTPSFEWTGLFTQLT